jgi:hypothetical protein
VFKNISGIGVSVSIIIIIIIIIIMALRPFVEPWPRFQFLDPINSRKDSLKGGQARRKASTYTEEHKYRIKVDNTDIHALNGIRTQDPSVRENEDSWCVRPRGHCDRRQSPEAPEYVENTI